MQFIVKNENIAVSNYPHTNIKFGLTCYTSTAIKRNVLSLLKRETYSRYIITISIYNKENMFENSFKPNVDAFITQL